MEQLLFILSYLHANPHCRLPQRLTLLMLRSTSLAFRARNSNHIFQTADRHPGIRTTSDLASMRHLSVHLCTFRQ